MKIVIRYCFVLVALGFFASAFSEILEVSAKEFMGNGISGKSVLKGNVEVKKNGDILRASEMEIYMDSNRRLKNIRAIGEVYFFVTTQDGRKVEGNCQELKYDAISGDYFLNKNAHLKEVGKENVLNGDAIFFNNKTGEMSIKGAENKPAKLIFNLDDK